MGRLGSSGSLAVAYFLAAKLGLLLAIPPGYATAVWPAAGIALAGVLLRPAAWPGVVAGSFLANLATASDAAQASLARSALVALSISLGAAAQAVLAGALIRRFVGFPNALTAPRDVGMFYLLGGPVACLLSASWGLATLLLSGVAAWRDALFNWWTWWVGDVIGCLTAAPLVLVWASRVKGGSLRRPLAVCLPLLAIFSSIVVLFLYTSAWENQRLRSEFDRRTDGLANRVTGDIDVFLEVLRSLANLYSSTSLMNGHVFREFVAHPLERHPGIQALSWNVRVEDARREAFEESLRREGQAGFRISERCADGALVRAGRRSEYVVVTYIEPRSGNQEALGFDVASDPERREALLRASQTGAPAATGAVRLIQGERGSTGFLVFVPAEAGPAAEAGAGARRVPSAYAVGVLRLASVMGKLGGAADTEGLEVELRDESAPPAERVLHRTQPGAGDKPAVFQRRVAFSVAGRSWALEFRLLPEYLARHRAWQAWSVLAVGLVFGGLLGAFLLVVTGRTIEIEELVRRRTAELQAEARARGRAQRELEQVVASVSDSLWAAEVTPGGAYTLSYRSPNLAELTGRPLDFFLEQGHERWMSIVAGEDRERVRARTERLVRGLCDREEAEYRIVLPGGGVRWVRDSLTASRTPNGNIQLSGVLADVTAARETARLARERERQAAEAKRDERFRSLIENASDVVLVLDGSGSVLYASPSVGSLLGPKVGRSGGQLLERIAPEDRAPLRDLLAELGAGDGAARPLRFRVRDEGGATRVMEGVARNLANKPEVGGIVVNCRDVTDRERLEAELRQAHKMEALGQLAGGVAHDFNNILGVITGYGELLAREIGALHPSAPRLLQIQKAAERASALTRQLLAFSRKQVQRLEVLDLNAIVGDLDQMLRRVIGEDIRLVTVLGPARGLVRADPGQLEQVLLNLVLNARDAMPTGGQLTIETSVVELDEAFAQDHPGAVAGCHVALSVSDTGHGIPPATLARIFEPFFTTKGEGRGTGLGLAMVYGIVKQSQGYIDVSSAAGKGTTFRVYLPWQAEGAAQPAGPEARHYDESPGGSETVLLVEDDANLRDLVMEVLSDAGYEVLEAARAEEAVSLARRGPPPALLLTDVIMPGMSGPDVAAAVAEAQPGIKVVYMSGYTQEALGRHGTLDPGTHLIEKPFSAHALLCKLREVLDGGPPAARPGTAPARGSP